MEKFTGKRILSLLLVLVMLFTLSPAAFSAGSESEDAAVEELEEVLPEEPEAFPAEDPAESPAEDPAENPAEDPAEDGEEPAEDAELVEEELTEEEEEEETAVELPYGFVGMGEDYVLSDEELARKALLKESLNTIAGLTPGVDYEEGKLLFIAYSEEYAQQVANAYCAELVSYSTGFASMRLTTATVLEAVTAAADETLPLPAVDPNYKTTLTPIGSSGGVVAASPKLAMANSVPQRQTWESWINGADSSKGQIPDDFLTNPNASNFQWMHEAVDSFGAWGVTTGSSNITVAVIDTGVAASHPDLKNVSSVQINIAQTDTSVPYGDHGTHVAGIIAASMYNGVGGCGIAPNVNILSIRACDRDGGFWDEDIMTAVEAAVNNGANIINISVGGHNYNNAENEFFRSLTSERGITVIASMGNDGSNIMCYPAAYDGVIAVGATNRSGGRAFFSNYGAWCDISAPGQGILSTVPGTYDFMDGTSQAAPVVSGVAALYMSKVGPVPASTMEAVLKKTATKCSSSGMGAGIVNAAKLFESDKTAPAFTVYDEYGETLTTYTAGIPFHSTISMGMLTATITDGDQNRTIVYTLDGKSPSVLNGELTNGEVYTAPLNVDELGNVGDTVTLKAAAVSGMGVMSNVVTLKIKILPSVLVSDVSINAPKQMLPGTTVNLVAAVLPEEADQTVVWSLTDDAPEGVTLNPTTGALKVPASASGTVTVIATSKKAASVDAEATITLSALSPVTLITVPEKAATIYYNSSFSSSYQITPVLTTKDGSTYAAASSYNSDDGIRVAWTSSNKKVAVVNADGLVTPVGKGSSTITCRALDGSNKTVTVKITVQKCADSISVTGQDSIAPGAYATFKAAPAPTDINNKKVTWTLVGAPAGVTVSTGGKVTVPAGVATGSNFLIVATSQDQCGAIGYKVITVREKVSAIQLWFDNTYSSPVYGTTNSKGILTSLTLLTVEPADYGDPTIWGGEILKNPTEVELVAEINGPYDAALTWTSSNPKIATVDENGHVHAISRGNATITCAANDGSGKKTTIKIVVVVPASSVTVVPQGNTVDGIYTLAFGKSIQCKGTLGTAYGKPSSTKLNWGFRLLYRGYNNSTKEYYNVDLTDAAKQEKLVSISSSGKVNVSKNLIYDWVELWLTDPSSQLILQVYADSNDYSWSRGWSPEIILIPPASYVTVLGDKTVTLHKNEVYPYYLQIESDSWFDDYTLTSSNPNICGAYFPVGEDGFDGTYFCIYAGNKTGTAKITVKTNDGSNKSYTLTVKVVN